MRYTPKLIVNKGIVFTIPLYQRLFEWDVENVIQLMDDLRSAFEESTKVPNDCEATDFYIGMLTSTCAEESGKRLQLVDGQQRITVMTLMGCVLQEFDSSWTSFLIENKKQRLTFVSRKTDDAYLLKLIQKDYEYAGELVNSKMKEAIFAIIKYMKRYDESQKKLFAQFAYEHLCFFISELPSYYSGQDLNMYFERMNSSGKNLENHEILKVKILRKLDGNVPLYMQLWNRIADVDTILLRKKDKENDDDFNKRKNIVLSSSLSEIVAQPHLINSLKEDNCDISQTISSVPKRDKKPQDAFLGHFNGSKSILRFPQLLLQVLYYYLKKRDGDLFRPKLEDFFNQSKLLETFKIYLPYEGAGVEKEHLKEFFELLLHCRVAMDVCFVRSLEYGFSLDMNLPEEDSELKELLMFESFLYVSSSNVTYYRWFGWMLSLIEKSNSIPTAKTLFNELKDKCDALNKLPRYENLNYDQEIRYWFWRLDFYIWQHRKELFLSEEDSSFLNIVDNYVFIRNRSIEHVAPRQPKNNSGMKWNDTLEDKNLRDSFGNLVMISQGLNSSLNNESYEKKREHVRSYINGSKTGTIESLKLLMIFKDFELWEKEPIKEHGKAMYDLLAKEIGSDTEPDNNIQI